MNTPIEKIKAMVAELGTRKAVAEKLCIDPSYLTYLLQGKRPITKQVADKLGFKKVVIFEPKEQV